MTGPGHHSKARGSIGNRQEVLGGEKCAALDQEGIPEVLERRAESCKLLNEGIIYYIPSVRKIPITYFPRLVIQSVSVRTP